MTPEEIQSTMAIIRPAIYAIFGRQMLTMSAYDIRSNGRIWIEVEGRKDEWIELLEPDGWGRGGYWDKVPCHYKLRLEDSKVTSLAEGRLSI